MLTPSELDAHAQQEAEELAAIFAETGTALTDADLHVHASEYAKAALWGPASKNMHRYAPDKKRYVLVFTQAYRQAEMRLHTVAPSHQRHLRTQGRLPEDWGQAVPSPASSISVFEETYPLRMPNQQGWF